MNAIDANVLIYAVDVAQPKKRQLARSLLRELEQSSQPLVLPWQAAVEFLACLRKWENAGRVTRSVTENFLEEFVLRFAIALPNTRLLHTSLQLTSKHSLSHWDSLLLAACIEAGVTTLYSEDMTDGETYGSVTVRNPFRDLKAK